MVRGHWFLTILFLARLTFAEVSYTSILSEGADFQWDIPTVKAIGDKAGASDGHSSCPCSTGTECVAVAAPCIEDTNIEGQCSRRSCQIDPNNCSLHYQYEPTIDGWVSFATCGHDNIHEAYKELDGDTLKVMYVPETADTYLGFMSGACSGTMSEYPTGCSGFTYDLLNQLQIEGNFKVEVVQELPLSFWDGVRHYCKASEGEAWGTADFTPDASSKGSSLCSLQKWTLCVYAAAVGYVDYCPNNAVQTDERWGYANGLIYTQDEYSLATKTTSADGLHQMFSLLQVWSIETWMVLLVWIVINSGSIAAFSGLYGSFKDGKGFKWILRMLADFPRIVWWGGGIFLDVVYPQNIPGIMAKLQMIIFEFMQLFLKVSITAAVTAVLMSPQTQGFMTIDEVAKANGKLCFPFTSYSSGMKTFFPEFPKEKIKAFDDEAEFKAEISSPNTECVGIVLKKSMLEQYHATEFGCEWHYRQRMWAKGAMGALSPRIETPMMSLFQRYKSKGKYQRLRDNANRLASGVSQCAAGGGTKFEYISSYYFLGLMIIWLVAIIFCILSTLIFGMPTGLSRHAYAAMTEEWRGVPPEQVMKSFDDEYEYQEENQ